MKRETPLRWHDVMSYGLGDMANNLVFSMGLLFLLPYYTDVAGIGAAAAGTLLMTVRVYDAVMDVAVGRIVDRGRFASRHGRFRPCLLWAAGPLLLFNMAVFSVPSGLSGTGRLVYAYVTYALLGTAYSFVNIPYGSLAAAMTQSPRERSLLAASRTLMSTGALILLVLVSGSVLRGAQGEASQERLTMLTGALAVVGMGLYGACFLGTRERIARGTRRAAAWRDSLSTLAANRALRVLCLAALCALAGAGSSGASALYFARYVMGDAGHFPTLVLATTPLGTLVSVFLGPMLAARFGRKAVFLSGMAVAALAHFLLLFMPASHPVWIIGCLAPGSCGLMLAMVAAWALEADTVEYGEWRSGLRLEGLNYALFSLTRKCGLALGGSIPAFLLAGTSYAPNLAAQHADALNAIRQAVALAPAIAFSAAFFIMLRYPLSEHGFVNMVREIETRRLDGEVE
ncbi:MAG: glycoside-pentoside-hexuronide (GPH):cation symporter [Candidatus Accumulibacter sp.]|jgi:glucuronide carrier protein|nr:glycoside-pentoside-hexuronide (GPH):cation symporter [Accumulibacter sp.]